MPDRLFYNPLIARRMVKSVKMNSSLSNKQLERLCAIVYLDELQKHNAKETLGEILAGLRGEISERNNWPCSMTKQEWLRVMDGIIDDESLYALHIGKIENTTENGSCIGHRAVLFIDPHKNGYIIFRGTGSNAEWLDNAQGMLVPETECQKAAANFVRGVKESAVCGSLTVAGHSKGGNKAQYAAIVLPEDYVSHCFSLDGQGFSFSFIENNKEAIKKRSSIIDAAAERRDFVNALGFQAVRTRYYSGRRGNPTDSHPHGEPLLFFHCPDALRGETDSIGPEAHMCPIPALVNQWVVYYLSEPKYANREKTLALIISLMTDDEKPDGGELAEALVEVLSAGVELIALNGDFRRIITDAAIHESEVITATWTEGTVEKNELGNSVIYKFARKLIADKQARKYFIEAMRYAVELTYMLADEKENYPLPILIFKSIETLLNHLSKGITAFNSIFSNLCELLRVCVSGREKKERRTLSAMFQLLDEWEVSERDYWENING